MGDDDRRAIGGGDHHLPGYVPSNTSWLNRLTCQQRRGSLGFSDASTAGTAPLSAMDEDSQEGHHGVVIPRLQTLTDRRGSLEIPSPGEDTIFGMNNVRTSAAGGGGGGGGTISITQSRGGHPNLEVNAPSTLSADLMPATALADRVTNALPSGEFPVATQESLEQLKEIKKRIACHAGPDDESVFSMDSEAGPTAAAGIDCHESWPQRPKSAMDQPDSKPPSRLASYLLHKGFAQNWFFKRDENEEDIDMDQPTTSGSKDHGQQHQRHRLNRSATVDETDTATYDVLTGGVPTGFQTAPLDSLNTEGFTGLAPNPASARKEKKKKQKLREANFFAPQNL